MFEGLFFGDLLSLLPRRKPATSTACVTATGSPTPAAPASRAGPTRPHTPGPSQRVRAFVSRLVRLTELKKSNV